MIPTLTATLMMPMFTATELPTAVWQVAPHVKVDFDGQVVEMKKTHERAAVLIHGLLLQPIRPERAARPIQHDWQQPKSLLVQALAPDFDVYSFGYGQTTSVDHVASCSGLRALFEKLKAAKYREIVLIGHSAGGLISRQFVERFPDAGVTRVIIVSTPNNGSELATINIGVPRTQVPFVKSLAPQTRIAIGKESPKLPKELEFCCVVCKVKGLNHDTLVNLESQWSKDLQQQGIPATLVAINHFEAMKVPHAVSTISELSREKLVRWTDEQIQQGRQVLFSNDADNAAIKNPLAKDRPLLRLIGKKIYEP